MSLVTRLDAIHAALAAGSRTASLDLYKEALAPLQAYLRRHLRRLSAEQACDAATDAIVFFANNPSRCDTGRRPFWSCLCTVGRRRAVDLLRRDRRETATREKIIGDVEFWASRAKEAFRGEDAIDARRIMTLYGGRLARTQDEATVLTLILQGSKRTEEFAGALGLDPAAADTEGLVKNAKDNLMLRLRRLRDEL